MMANFFQSLDRKVFKYKQKYNDNPNKAALHLLAWNIKSIFKKWDISKEIPQKENSCVENAVLFNLQGGLGDILIAINYLIQLKNKLDEKIIFYVTLPDLLQKSAEKIVNDAGCIQLADSSLLDKNWALNVDLCRIPHIRAIDFEIVKKMSETLYEWACGIFEFNEKYPEYVKAGTVNDYLLTKFTQMVGRNRLSQADVNNFINVKDVFKLKVSDEQKTLKEYVLDKCQYITLQCGTGCYCPNAVSTREWPIDKFNKLIKLIKKQYPNIKTIQIGSSKDLRMDADIDLCGITTFDEFLVILKNATLHIGSESGCVHMRHFMCAKPSVVLFGPTNKDFYGYKENLNVSSEVCSGCEWLHSGWYKHCCISGNEPVCMMQITPEFVFKQLTTLL